MRDMTYLGWSHHLFGLRPLRDFRDGIVVINAPIRALEFLPWTRLAEVAINNAVHLPSFNRNRCAKDIA